MVVIEPLLLTSVSPWRARASRPKPYSSLPSAAPATIVPLLSAATSPKFDVACTAKLYLPSVISIVPLLITLVPLPPSAITPKLPSVTVTRPVLSTCAAPYCENAAAP